MLSEAIPCPFVTTISMQAGLALPATFQQHGSRDARQTRSGTADGMGGPLHCRSQGIGSQLVEQLLQSPEAQRCDILLTTLARTIPFYQPWGFRQIPWKEFPRSVLSNWVCTTGAMASLVCLGISSQIW